MFRVGVFVQSHRVAREEELLAGRYRLVRRIGSGGMGVVWQAYDERLHRKVAVKRLLLPPGLTGPQTAEARRLAMREGRIAAKLQHPHAIAVYDVLEDEGQSYLIMEYVPSTSLAQELAERGTLPPAAAARVGSQVAAALAAAHAAGVVHRDIKPGNVLLDEQGAAKITDFGISRAVEDVTATATGLIAGTPAYLAPEVAQGLTATYQSDVFSLGATLYTAIEGVPPVGSTDNAMAMLYRAASGDFVPPKQAGPMTALLTEMLSVDPSRRPTMTQVRARLDALSPGPEPSPPTEPPHGAARPPARRTRSRVIVLAAAALVLLAVVAAILTLSLPADRSGAGTAAPAQPTPSTTTPQTVTSQPVQPPASSPPATSAPPPASSEAPPPAAARQSLAGTITGYYALMPGDLRQAWTWLTPKYQQHPAGGYGGYQTFWSRIRAVRVTDANPLPGNKVEATVDYTFTDGHVVRERHRYTLINPAGAWMIDESTVLSSQTL